jgi:predicted aspartyl protease
MRNSVILGYLAKCKYVWKSRQTKLITAVIDTGYTGFLSLPSEIISELNLSWTGINRGTLGVSIQVIEDPCQVRTSGFYRLKENLCFLNN